MLPNKVNDNRRNKRITSRICFLMFLFSMSLFPQSNINFLTSKHSKEFILNSITQDHSWIKYPDYTDRKGWEKIPELTRQNVIEGAEKYIGYKWPSISATMYLEFTRSGNRENIEKILYKRLDILKKLVMAELCEGKQRFIDDIIDGVFSICEQSYWGMPSAFYMYKSGFKDLSQPNTILPDVDDPIIDLYVADTAGNLAWIWYFFHKEFDKISPIISVRLKSEVEKKVLIPFYERSDFWWLTGWGKGDVNNWTPWCNYNILTCIVLLEDDIVKKVDGIYKTMNSVDLYINSYPNDGSCEEGPNYWSVGGGKLFDYLLLLKQVTNNRVDIFNQEIIKKIGQYIYKIYISSLGTNGQYYANYSDSPPIIRQDGARIYRYGREINDSIMKSFGFFLLKELQFEHDLIVERIGESLENLFDIEGWQQYKIDEPLLFQYYFSDSEMAIAREKHDSNKGFYFFAKGGNNGVSHNHNDVGSCILFFDGNPVFIDVGVGTYTAKTFSKDRYSIWTMQSEYHNLPVINGYGQNAGKQYKAMNSDFIVSNKKAMFSTDIHLAYPEEAGVNKWKRKYTLDREKKIFVIEDSYKLNQVIDSTLIHFITPLNCKLLKPGLMELTNGDRALYLKYNSSNLEVFTECIRIEDDMILKNWRKTLYRINFRSINTSKHGDIKFEILQKS